MVGCTFFIFKKKKWKNIFFKKSGSAAKNIEERK
jgi:hypothetical protein